MSLCRHFPQRVNSLLVWGAQARWIASPDHPWGQTQEEHDRMVAMIDDDWPSFEYITGPGAGVGKDADPAFIESLSRYMRAAANPSAVHAYEQMNGQIDTRPILPSIQAPALVMNRTGDPCANAEAARDMHCYRCRYERCPQIETACGKFGMPAT